MCLSNLVREHTVRWVQRLTERLDSEEPLRSFCEARSRTGIASKLKSKSYKHLYVYFIGLMYLFAFLLGSSQRYKALRVLWRRRKCIPCDRVSKFSRFMISKITCIFIKGCALAVSFSTALLRLNTLMRTQPQKSLSRFLKLWTTATHWISFTEISSQRTSSSYLQQQILTSKLLTLACLR